ncbi:uncharacterized protein LOC130726834 isoform X1 [Lotus japonicus]|uniref:uncharacterized protein LOC130726834 isoform X1 n=1 Tax=Lotus japonicus TaxID=34305 RepID=UPI00258FA9DF|nr:uncharacterized protein LOC130726834 isoform X1 [Lotus japonicus]XP_057434129.1 uncharacterized protein LOC130726834 isoform X1 [Lotus japonicus]XP_057434130.1 uncharacterized protein LOC130726834 isoform X1 [Lotus japonicus]XP_057434131.1 uncharacterized protein LOC130726834 isoform X1 [Lotus japonicus]XP_057434132.1 uncharacterized protein LOC130726834 isoform X1 [Lotus japonicus]XP_057434133.1 uncharacterized protein LOC130726834 isoform X1 [Lotus japonicus]XP_057434134.1 uncharacterize
MFMGAKRVSIAQMSFLEASNLQVLIDSSLIHSNANMEVCGQSFLNLSELGNLMGVQHLILSAFTNRKVGSGPVLRGPLEVLGEDNMMAAQLYWEIENCVVELPHPPEKCNMNSSWILTLLICRVEIATLQIYRVEIAIVEVATTGSGLHFPWIRRLSVEVSIDVDFPTIIQLQVQSKIPFCSTLKALTPNEMIKQGVQAVSFHNTDGIWYVNWQKDSKSCLLDSCVIYMILRVVKADAKNTNNIPMEKHMDPSYVICSLEYGRLTQEIQKLIEGEGDIVTVRVRMKNTAVCIITTMTCSTLDVKRANEETEQQPVISSHMFISRRARTPDLVAQAVCYACTQADFAEEIFSKSWTHMIEAKTLLLGLLVAIECKMNTWDPGGCSYFSATTWSTSCFKQWDSRGVLLSQPLPSCLNEEGELQPELEQLLISRSGQQGDREVPMKWKNLPDFDSSWESLAAMKKCFQLPSLRTRMFLRKGEMIGTQILVVLVLLRYLLGRVEREIKLIPTSDNCQADVAVSSGC